MGCEGRHRTPLPLQLLKVLVRSVLSVGANWSIHASWSPALQFDRDATLSDIVSGFRETAM